jgi:hypothetical membrane protein
VAGAEPAAAGRPSLLVAAACFWFLAGAVYLVTEAISAAGYPGYSYAHDYISDLGIPYAQRIDGRQVLSSRAIVMNGGFVVEGLCFALAVLAFARAERDRSWTAYVFLLLGLVHSAGLVLIAFVHGGGRELAAGTFRWHMIGAGMAIVGGNLAILTASRLFRRLGPVYRTVSALLGGSGLLSLSMLTIADWWPIVAEGSAERGSVYAISAWEIMTGLLLLAWARGNATASPG